MANFVRDNIIIENAHILFRNFSGTQSKFNRDGDRNFSVIIEDDDTAKDLAEIGWNIKTLQPRDEDGEPLRILPVSVSYNVNPPQVYLITAHKKVELTESTIKTLDHAEITNVDLTIRPYNWEVNERTGVKAYLKNMYVTINEDPFAAKYNMD